jgi:prepilin-type processing-associated H-X9-DG protein
MRNVVSVSLVFLMLVLLGSLFGTVIAKGRAAALRMTCRNNLRQIGLAVHSYNDANAHFPPATDPNPALPAESRFSWLVSLVPYVEATNIDIRRDRQKGWDAEENRYLALTDLRYLHCPGFPNRPPVSTLLPTHYVGIAGLGTDAAALPLEDQRAGFFGYERKVSASLIEGSSTLLAVLETTRVTGAWTAAGPATVRGVEGEGPPLLGADGEFGGLHYGGTNALFADGSVRFLRESLDPGAIRARASIHGRGGLEPIGDE